MARRREQFRRDRLTYLVRYILERRPDEFGLLPDAEGFVPVRELLKALHEEQGYGFVRESHLREILLTDARDLLEMQASRIRAREKDWEIQPHPPSEPLPEPLFAAVRRRAHAVVMKEGLTVAEGGFAALTPSRELALRMGRRRDPEPVILTISSRAAQHGRVPFWRVGDLYLVTGLPARFITGPPLSKEAAEPPPRPAPRRETPTPVQPGSFVLDGLRDPDPMRRARRGQKPKGWKEQARKARRKSKK